MYQIPHPVEIDGGVDAVVLQQGNGHAWNGGRLHVGEALFQHVDTTYADDRFDFSGFDHRADDGRALRHQHRIPESLGLHREVLDGTEAALFAEQSEFVKRRRTLVFHPEALGNQQQPPVVGNLRERLAPRRVAHQDRGVVRVNRIEAGGRQHGAGVLGQLVQS